MCRVRSEDTFVCWQSRLLLFRMLDYGVEEMVKFLVCEHEGPSWILEPTIKRCAGCVCL